MLSQKERVGSASQLIGSAIAVKNSTNVVINRCMDSENDALALLADLTKEAEKIQSRFCKIDGRIERVRAGIQLTATFRFCCGADSLLFRSILL